MKKIFVAMPINPEFDDVIDAIKQVGTNLNMDVVRIDQQESNEKISDRIIEEIRTADFIIADLTKSRPNVFFEAGYALGYGIIPIFIAKNGTSLEFDIHDYPVIFYGQYVELKERLKKRIEDAPPPKKESSGTVSSHSALLFDENDIKAILTDWVSKRLNQGNLGTIVYSKIDSELGFEAGSTKKYIADVITSKWSYEVEHEGANAISFSVKPRPRSGLRKIGGINFDAL
jgi:nucleoside 2-deoxyribosyltransferase